MQTKYSEVISKLLAGEEIFIELDENTNKESLRTAMSKEKRRQEDLLKSFEIPVENTRLCFKHQKNGTFKIFLRKLDLGFQILTDVPPLPQDTNEE